jgi:glycosyltransferase involved in cell wall biosynthesis
VRPISDGLTVLAPFVIPIYGNAQIRALNTKMLEWQIKRALPRGAQPILWIFLPALVGLVGQFDEKLVIYHCIDEHAANPNVPAQPVKENEMRLLKRANIVFASAKTLYEDKRAFNPHTYYLPNVADADFFAQAREPALPVADDLKNLSHPMAGFVGNITAYKLDIDLLCAVAREKSNWQFVLIGPIGRGDPATDVSKLQALSNVHLLGERAYAELPRYVKAFDACLIPFKRNESTRGSLPMKFFEYLATGKPVIATNLPALAEFHDYFYRADTVAEFSAALDVVLREPGAAAAKRIEIARQYSWDARMQEIGKIVNAALRQN